MKIEKQLVDNLPDHISQEKNVAELFTAIGQLLDEVKDEINSFRNYSNYQEIKSSKFEDLANTFGLNFPRNLGDENRSSLVRDIISIYRTKGTEKAMKHMFRLIGWNVQIEYVWINKDNRLLEYIYPSDYLFGSEELFDDGMFAVLEDHTGKDIGKVRIHGESYKPESDMSPFEVIKTPYIKVTITAEDFDLFTEDSVGDDGTIYSFTDSEEFEIVQNIIDFFTDRNRPANVAIIDIVTPFNITTTLNDSLFSTGNFEDTTGSTTDTDYIYESSTSGYVSRFDGTFLFDYPSNPYIKNEFFSDVQFDSEDFSVTKGDYPESDTHYIARFFNKEETTNFVPVIPKSNMKLSIPDGVSVTIFTSKQERAKMASKGYNNINDFSNETVVDGPYEEYSFFIGLNNAVAFKIEDNRNDQSETLYVFVEIAQVGEPILYDDWFTTNGEDFGEINTDPKYYWPNRLNIQDTPSEVYDYGSITS